MNVRERLDDDARSDLADLLEEAGAEIERLTTRVAALEAAIIALQAQ